MRRKFLPILLLILAAFAVYAPALRDGFVWDDTALVLRDPLIRSWRLIPEGFRHFLFLDATPSDFYRPIQRLSFTVDYALWGFTPAYYHLTNILLHGLAAGALYLFAHELTKKRGLSFLAALIWAIHPLNSSAIIYVAGRADLLAAIFGFAALWLALRKQLALAGLGFLLALLSKESAFAFLLIWWAILLWRRLGAELPAALECGPAVAGTPLALSSGRHVSPIQSADPAMAGRTPKRRSALQILASRLAFLFFGLDQMGNEEIGALLHFLAPHIENFRAKLLAAVDPLQVHDFRISSAGSVIVPGDRRNLKALLNEIAQSRKHFHLHPTSCH